MHESLPARLHWPIRSWACCCSKLAQTSPTLLLLAVEAKPAGSTVCRRCGRCVLLIVAIPLSAEWGAVIYTQLCFQLGVFCSLNTLSPPLFSLPWFARR